MEPPAIPPTSTSSSSSGGSSGYSGNYGSNRPPDGGLNDTAQPGQVVVRRRAFRQSVPVLVARSNGIGSTGETQTTEPTRQMAAVAAPALCKITKTRLPAAVCDELTEQNQLTQTGIDVAPTNLKMSLKQTMTYTYSVGAQGAETVVRRNVATGSGRVSVGTVALGHYNFARLSGDAGIKIESLDEEVQDTVENPTPVWRWKLTALESGPHVLSLEAGVELRAENAKPVRLGQNSKRIDVAVDVTGVDKIAQFANTTNTVLGISTDLLKKLAVFFGAVSAALIAFRAIRGKSKADVPS
jgi:hypothetical protein